MNEYGVWFVIKYDVTVTCLILQFYKEGME